MLELKHIFLDSLQLFHPITCDQDDVCAMVLFSFSAESKPISFFTNFRGQCFGLEAVKKVVVTIFFNNKKQSATLDCKKA